MKKFVFVFAFRLLENQVSIVPFVSSQLKFNTDVAVCVCTHSIASASINKSRRPENTTETEHSGI